MQAWAVLAESIIDSRYEALRAGQILLLVARRNLRRCCVAAASQDRRRARRAARVSLAWQVPPDCRFGAKVRGAPHALVHWLCSPLFQDTPLYPIVRQIERAAKVLRDDLSDKAR